MPQTSMIGMSGVYYVAAYLNGKLGYHAALTIGNVPHVDLLVSSPDGGKSLSLQVKTTTFAMRERGRGAERKPDHYEWDIGWGTAQLEQKNLYYALVDLRDFQTLPDVFIVPSKVIADYFSAGPKNWPRARYHEAVDNLASYKNAWVILEKNLT